MPNSSNVILYITGLPDFLANNAAARVAAQKSEISGIRIGYYWDRSLEEITVTALINEAV